MRESPKKLATKFIPPMLATLVTKPPGADDDWVYELKYDGFRAVCAVDRGEVAMLSRNGLDLVSRFPSIAESLSKLKGPAAVLDGEIVVLDEKGVPRFQLLQRGGQTLLYVFDILWLDGHDLRREPLENRRELLEKYLRRAPKGIAIAERLEKTSEEALEWAREGSFEGIIAKRRGSLYEPRRSKEWLKLKAINMQELAVVGFTPSTHSDREIGALLLGVVDGGKMQYAGRVGTGFSAKQRVDLRTALLSDKVKEAPVAGAPRMRDATWVTPRLVAQVQFTEWTSDGKLRHPSFLGFRIDKKPEECVREKPAAPSDVAEKKKSTSGKRKTTAAKSSSKKSPVIKTAAKKPAAKAASKKTPARAAAAPTIVLTNPDRIVYPKDGITKKEVADYFDAMAEPMIHALRDRPLALEHWNAGISKPSWFHQNVDRDVEPWMSVVETPTRTTKKTVKHLTVDSREALRWLAQRSALTIHMWSSRRDSLDTPDWVVFDLDPAKGKGIEQAIDAAIVLRGLLEKLELPSVPKTSGKRGIHVFVPLAPKYDHEEVAEFAYSIAVAITSQVPYATVERSIEKRRGRLYFDALQNGYGKTVVAPYSLRAIDGAPVSAPLKWSEVNSKLDPLKFNLRTMPDRLAKVGDLFRPALEDGVVLPRLK